MRRRLLASLVLLALAAAPASAVAAQGRASLTDIENDVMCTSCRESLAVAQSPQAQAERNFIRGLIARGLDKTQIERILVAQYGTAVLARPPAHGFNLTVYILPPAIVVVGLGLLATFLPRWRRRARDESSTGGSHALTTADARRLDEELARFGG